MKKNELSPEDFSALANAVAELPFVQPNRAPADYMLCKTACKTFQISGVISVQ